MREEEKLTQDNRTKSSDEKLLKITLTDTMPNYFSHREKKNADTQQGPTNRARISSEFLSERSLKDRCYPQNYFLSSFDSYSAAPLPSSLLSTSQQKLTCHSFTQPGGKLNLRLYDCQNIIKKKTKLADLRNNLKTGLLQYIVLHHCFNFPPKSGIRFL